ncbi:hypothetical protein [Chroococcus sp. FPU101]|uniref:hypothetical protein n=1 Tax=Chroococcus sp. FPU101 TaxID=1974212 RepID=UPI001A8EF022|nr:hypothetical protein [Chroococcus sp. FPU101]GFE68606.1 hypothetical protein CFPU101_12160 [Chroococcus sp. FPU101]
MKSLKLMIFRIRLTLVLVLSILFTNFSLPQQALASPNFKENVQKLDKAANTIDKEEEKEATKDTYGQYEESNELIDKARETAKENLENMANPEYVNPERSLPENQK